MTTKRENKTLFVAQELAEPEKRPAAKRARAASDVTRVRPAYVAGLTGCVGLGLGLAFSSGSLATPSGPGPLTPSHVKAKLTCKSCHGGAESGSSSFKENALEACESCHGAHPSTRAGHSKLRKRGELGCVDCHQIHGSQTGVRFPEEGDAVRYSTFGERTVEGLSFHSERTLVVPTIPEKACLRCHDESADDPFARCRTRSELGRESPTVCFDEHVAALPADNGKSPKDGKSKRSAQVCADQHFEDRPFVWEAAREAIEVGPPARTTEAPTLAPLLGGVGSAALGYAATSLLRRKRRKAVKQDAPLPVTVKRLPLINTSTCLGCYACVDACPYGVLEVKSYVAVVARPDACCGLLLCEQTCPNGSLVVAEEGSLLDRPRIGPTLESLDVPGVFLAGDITGVPLIKTAIAQGVRAAEAAHKKLGKSRRSDDIYDVCVIGAGPAGISAMLRLKELGLRATAVDQGSVAQSIQNFPRGKLVFDQPLELPVLGKLWLKESTKEELLLHWTRIVRKEQLDIRERTRMLGVRPEAGGFSIETREAGPEAGTAQDGRSLTVRARAVILAIGQRGTPRKLAAAIPEELQSSVHYHLADARSLAGKRVVIVGIGDVAMESALALSAQARTQVTIVARAATYSRGQSRNIAELERQRKAGRISVLWQSEVEALAAERGHGLLTVRSAGAKTRLPFDSLFVLIGTIPPWDTLQALGITRAQAEPARSVFLADEKTLRSET